MATVNRVVDDFNPELDATTRQFELLGKGYEIDVADQNMEFLNKALEQIMTVLEHARPASTSVESTENGKGGISSNRRSRSNGKSVSNTRKKPVRKVQRAVDGAAPKAVRQWCLDNDVPVSPTGIIQKSAYEAYNEAHKKD